MRLTDKQQFEFRVLAPDEPELRAKFEKSHPDQVQSLNSLLSKLRSPDLFADQEEDDDNTVEEGKEVDD